jgi:membrane protease subunit HflK
MKEVVLDISRFTPWLAPERARQAAVWIVAAIAIIVVASQMFYQVGPDEAGVVTRFGRYVRTSGPGLRVMFPFIESVTKAPVQRQLRQQFGFRTDVSGVRTAGNFGAESTMLTGDLNVVVVEWIVQYRIADPYAYIFKVRDTDKLFADMTEAVMQEAVGDRTVTEVVTVGRTDIEATVQKELQQLVDQYQMGLQVTQVVLQDVNPPASVKPSWDQVNQAQQQRDKLINDARTDYNKVVPLARGQAEQTVLTAQGYALDRVNRASGDAARFDQQVNAYRQAPDVTRRRLYLETMSRVLPKVGGKVILDKDAKNIVPLLPLNQLTAAVGSGVATPAAANKAGGR